MNSTSFASACWQLRRTQITDLAFEPLDDLDEIARQLLESVRRHDPSASQRLSKKFQPQGVSIALVGGHCRVLVHSWPERGILTLDVSAPRDNIEPLWKAALAALNHLTSNDETSNDDLTPQAARLRP